MLSETLRDATRGDLSGAVHQAIKALTLAYEAGKTSPRELPRHPFVETARREPFVGDILREVERTENRSIYRLTKKALNRYSNLLLKDLYSVYDTKKVDRKRLTQLFAELDAIPM